MYEQGIGRVLWFFFFSFFLSDTFSFPSQEQGDVDNRRHQSGPRTITSVIWISASSSGRSKFAYAISHIDCNSRESFCSLTAAASGFMSSNLDKPGLRERKRRRCVTWTQSPRSFSNNRMLVADKSGTFDCIFDDVLRGKRCPGCGFTKRIFIYFVGSLLLMFAVALVCHRFAFSNAETRKAETLHRVALLKTMHTGEKEKQNSVFLILQSTRTVTKTLEKGRGLMSRKRMKQVSTEP